MRTRTRRVVALATAIPVLALSMGTSGKTVRAAPSDEASQTLQLVEAPPGLAAQQAYEIWLTTALADTVDRGAYKKELAEWKRLHTETLDDYAAYMASGALYTAVAADTAAKKTEAGILDDFARYIFDGMARVFCRHTPDIPTDNCPPIFPPAPPFPLFLNCDVEGTNHNGHQYRNDFYISDFVMMPYFIRVFAPLFVAFKFRFGGFCRGTFRTLCALFSDLMRRIFGLYVSYIWILCLFISDFIGFIFGPYVLLFRILFL